MTAMTFPPAAASVRRLGWWQYLTVFAALPAPQAIPQQVDFLAEFVGPALAALECRAVPAPDGTGGVVWQAV